MEASIGIDMGGTSIKIGLVENNVLVEAHAVPASAHETLEHRLKDLTQSVNVLVRKNNVQLAGVGLAFPGVVDADNKKILSRYVKYPDAQEVDLAAWVKKEWDVPFAMDNDARAALVGEWQFGAGKGYENLVLVTLGTGMGSAALMEGRIVRGKHHLAGNLGGHMSVNLHGRICNCGHIGCVESEASTWSLRQNLRQDPEFSSSALSAISGSVGFEDVFQFADKGDALASKVRQTCLKAWALGIINLILAYDPERVVMGGAIMKSKDAIIPFINDLIRRDTWINGHAIEIVAAEQVEHAGILGMAWLASKQ